MLGVRSFLYAQLLHPGLAFRAVVPGAGGGIGEAFVTADVDVFGREDAGDFVEDVAEEGENLLVSGAEDFAGDMDFKVTGTTEGITALQMDMKVHGLPISVLSEAIKKAHDGRMFILKHMLSVLAGPRDHLSPYAPRIEKLMINPDKIGTVIGKGGETINKITAETGAEINIEENGLITVSAADNDKIEKALNWIKSLVEEPEPGKIYKGKVVTIKDFGAFVNILPGIDGMLHISQISDKRIAKVTDALQVGDEINVRLDAIDDKGRLSLSMKGVDQKA